MNDDFWKNIRKKTDAIQESKFKVFNGHALPEKAFSSYSELVYWVNDHQEVIDVHTLELIVELELEKGVSIIASPKARPIAGTLCPLFLTQPSGFRSVLGLKIWIGPLPIDSIPRMLSIYGEDPLDSTRLVPIFEPREMFSLAGNNSGAYIFRTPEDAVL